MQKQEQKTAGEKLRCTSIRCLRRRNIMRMMKSDRRKPGRASGNRVASPIDSIPREMTVEILARVAAASFGAFFNAKQCCKSFDEASEDDLIYKRISLDKFAERLWWRPNKAKDFLRRCIRSGNLEALYRQGLHEYFSSMNLPAGMTFLRQATEAGHAGASYTLGIIYVCSEDHQLKEEGVSILKKMHVDGKVTECREKYERTINGMWLNNRSIMKEKPSYDCALRSEHWGRRGWSRDHVQMRDGVDCEACLCEAEMMFLYQYCQPVS